MSKYTISTASLTSDDDFPMKFFEKFFDFSSGFSYDSHRRSKTRNILSGSISLVVSILVIEDETRKLKIIFLVTGNPLKTDATVQ